MKRITVTMEVSDDLAQKWAEKVRSVEVVEPVCRTRLTLETGCSECADDWKPNDEVVIGNGSLWTVVSCEQIESYE